MRRAVSTTAPPSLQKVSCTTVSRPCCCPPPPALLLLLLLAVLVSPPLTTNAWVAAALTRAISSPILSAHSLRSAWQAKTAWSALSATRPIRLTMAGDAPRSRALLQHELEPGELHAFLAASLASPGDAGHALQVLKTRPHLLECHPDLLTRLIAGLSTCANVAHAEAVFAMLSSQSIPHAMSAFLVWVRRRDGVGSEAFAFALRKAEGDHKMLNALRDACAQVDPAALALGAVRGLEEMRSMATRPLLAVEVFGDWVLDSLSGRAAPAVRRAAVRVVGEHMHLGVFSDSPAAHERLCAAFWSSDDDTCTEVLSVLHASKATMHRAIALVGEVLQPLGQQQQAMQRRAAECAEEMERAGARLDAIARGEGGEPAALPASASHTRCGSAHPYESNADSTTTVVLSEPSVLVFSTRSETEQDYDFLDVTYADPSGAGSTGGAGAGSSAGSSGGTGTVKTKRFTGPSREWVGQPLRVGAGAVALRFVSDDSNEEWGYECVFHSVADFEARVRAPLDRYCRLERTLGALRGQLAPGAWDGETLPRRRRILVRVVSWLLDNVDLLHRPSAASLIPLVRGLSADASSVAADWRPGPTDDGTDDSILKFQLALQKIQQCMDDKEGEQQQSGGQADSWASGHGLSTSTGYLDILGTLGTDEEGDRTDAESAKVLGLLKVLTAQQTRCPELERFFNSHLGQFFNTAKVRVCCPTWCC